MLGQTDQTRRSQFGSHRHQILTWQVLTRLLRVTLPSSSRYRLFLRCQSS
jgi:hypothetical protein